MKRVDEMRHLAQELLSSLNATEVDRVATAFDAPDHRKWTYLPGPRAGLRLGDVTEEQQELALALLDTGCSAQGAATARGIIFLERILDELIGYDSGGDPYWVRILGDPTSERWAWRVNGHHLAVHVTIVDDAFRVTPNFFGAQPAEVPRGSHQGLRTLPREEDLARQLLDSLDEQQRARAVVSVTAPADILTRHDPVADPTRLSFGLGWMDMTTAQRETLRTLVRCYFDRAPEDLADRSWQAVVSAGLESVSFAWAGSDRPGHGHYYSVHGPTFVIEYDNTQDGANHIHTVWRDLEADWGEDLLAAHYNHQHQS